MKFASFDYQDKEMFGVIHPHKDVVLPLPAVTDWKGPKTLFDYINAESDYHDIVRSIYEDWVSKERVFVEVAIDSLVIYAPIPKPRKNIFAVGKNYLDHAKEMGSSAAPEAPVLFSKAPTSVVGHNDDVQLHLHATSQVDYEGELAVIIGKKGTRISKENAMDYVFGFTILNDVTARDLQQKHQQFLLGKSLDTFCPMGPFVVEKDDFMPLEKKTVVTKVNGELRQKATFDLMIYSIPVIIETLSAGMTLEPGDIIATGTPKGVGKGFHPPKFLKAGDVVEIEIDGIGLLKNRFVENID